VMRLEFWLVFRGSRIEWVSVLEVGFFMGL